MFYRCLAQQMYAQAKSALAEAKAAQRADTRVAASGARGRLEHLGAVTRYYAGVDDRCRKGSASTYQGTTWLGASVPNRGDRRLGDR
jgi:hypothetical protein